AKKNGIGAFFVKLVLTIILLPVFFFGFSMLYPHVGALKEKNPEKTAFMRYREREWKREGIDRKIIHTWAPISRISSHVVKAVIISEDDKFWTHEGFDFEALEEAARKNLERKKFAFGGSTISQQLAKNLYLSPEKNVIRKLKEAIITWRLEHTLSKRRILELYLNYAEWGEGIFGIEAAARHYYRRSAASLSASQAAHLAAVLPNPRRWNPTGGSRLVERRAGRILSVMARRGDIQRQYEDIMKEKPRKEETEATNQPDSTEAIPPDSEEFAPSDSVRTPPPETPGTDIAPPVSEPDSGGVPSGNPTNNVSP
ncbi:MAG: monofunctional biosynthetic peptidoglycan transglycosylase, partial [Candidatus Latescibacterota bacterium]